MMFVEKVIINNFKKFKVLPLELKNGINILVGDNEAGKSTVLEALDLAFSGVYNNRYLKNELSQSIFNKSVVDEYLKSLNSPSPLPPPEISIEVFINGDGLARFEGDNNSLRESATGFTLWVKIEERNHDLYEEWLSCRSFSSLPIEFYSVVFDPFSRDPELTFRNMKLKADLIDSSARAHSNSSDLYVTKIIKNLLESKETIDVAQAFRKSKDSFSLEGAIVKVNEKIKTAAKITNKNISITIDQPTKNAWEYELFTYLDGIPFSNVGKGEQCTVKTMISLAENRANEKHLILMEEPENHLSHSRLNSLMRAIHENIEGRQIVVSTHSSFVANKLGLDKLVLMASGKYMRLSQLKEETIEFFQKISGYDTLRLLLCKMAILVEGDSDELVVQKAYMVSNAGKLPIEDQIDVISVGTSFLRFLDIAKLLNLPVRVVIDNDGKPESIREKFKDHLSEKIKICFDDVIDSGDLKIGEEKYNYNTLEPKLLKVNSLDKLNAIFGVKYKSEDELRKYMQNNKTDCALKVFSTKESIVFPKYILDSISNV